MTDPRLIHLDLGSPHVCAYLVDGKTVRDEFDVEFTMGAHEYRYSWTPQGEIWIDNVLGDDELLPTLAHELFERGLMLRGMEYNMAHTHASAFEDFLRDRPEFAGRCITYCIKYNSGEDMHDLSQTNEPTGA